MGASIKTKLKCSYLNATELISVVLDLYLVVFELAEVLEGNNLEGYMGFSFFGRRKSWGGEGDTGL